MDWVINDLTVYPALKCEFLTNLSIKDLIKTATKLINKITVQERMGNCNKPDEQNVVAPSSLLKAPRKLPALKLPEQPGLSLIIRCWKQTNNTLFNFHLKDEEYDTKVFTINLKKIRIVKIGSLYQALLPEDEEFKKIMPPIMIDIRRLKTMDKFGQKIYEFVFNDFPKISKPFWLVVKSLPSQRYLLKQGDIFKMGKLKLRVKEIIDKRDEVKQIDRQIHSQYCIYEYDGRQFCNGIINKQAVCRICNDEGQNKNPLISLCKCDGTMKYTHYQCLKKWFTIQLSPSKVNLVTQITWKVLQCQYCKSKMPYSVNIDNDNYFLVTFPKIKKPYLVINPVYKNSNEKSKIYYFVSFKKVNRMVIGRSGQAQIQICTDATMSRSHSVIQYVKPENQTQRGKFYLSDCSSKFGTVVLMKTKRPILVQTKMHGIQFQVGGDIIKVSYNAKGSHKYMLTKEDQVDFNQQLDGSESEEDKDIMEEEDVNDKISNTASGNTQRRKDEQAGDMEVTHLGRKF